MNKIYHLSTCSTCKRILSELHPDKDVILQDIKTIKITVKQLDEMANLAGSYEALFSRIARKYKELELGKKSLTEKNYRDYILEEYTFLKRPVVIVGKQIFIGNSPKVVAATKIALKR